MSNSEQSKNKVLPDRVYCRGCNRSFKPVDEDGESFIEFNWDSFKKAIPHHHPKHDCDIEEE